MAPVIEAKTQIPECLSQEREEQKEPLCSWTINLIFKKFILKKINQNFTKDCIVYGVYLYKVPHQTKITGGYTCKTVVILRKTVIGSLQKEAGELV